MLIGVCIWGVFGRIEATTPAAVVTENGESVCLVPTNALEGVLKYRTVKVDGTSYELEPSVLEPGEDFEPSGKRKTVFSYAKERLTGTSAAVTFVVLTTTISSLIGVISPVFGRVFLDRLLSGRNPEWLLPFTAALCAFSLINVVVLWIATVYNLRIQGKMEAVGSANYLWKVLRLPMSFFSQRHSADIAGRQSTNASIAGGLVNTFAPLSIYSCTVRSRSVWSWLSRDL